MSEFNHDFIDDSQSYEEYRERTLRRWGCFGESIEVRFIESPPYYNTYLTEKYFDFSFELQRKTHCVKKDTLIYILDKALKDAYAKGYEESYNTVTDSLNEAVEDEYKDGVSEGYNKGYDEGLEDGKMESLDDVFESMNDDNILEYVSSNDRIKELLQGYNV